MKIEVGDKVKATHVSGDTYVGVVTDVYGGDRPGERNYEFLNGDVDLYESMDWSFEIIRKRPPAQVGDVARDDLPIGTLIETKETSCAGHWYHSARGWVDASGTLFERSTQGDLSYLIVTDEWKIAYLPAEN